MAEGRYSRFVSLGRTCECAHQIRRFTGIESAFYFDWLGTPHEGLVRALRSRFSGCFLKENLAISDGGVTVRDSRTQISYRHNFSKLAGTLIIDPQAIDREYQEQQEKMDFLARRWFETLEKEAILFIRHDTPSVQQALELYDVLAEQVPSRDVSLLIIAPHGHELGMKHPRIFIETCDISTGPGAWRGDDTVWNNILCKYWHEDGATRQQPSSTDRPGLCGAGIQYDLQTIAVMEQVLRINSNCIDIGAHRGNLLREMLQRAPLGTHFAFEPLPGFLQKLHDRFREYPNLLLSDRALSDTSGESPFFHVVTNSSYSGLRLRRYDRPNEQVEQILVETECLDRVIPKGLAIDFIKIDVEGAELQVLRGAIDTICRNAPYIVFEHGVGGADCYGTQPEDIFDLLVGQCNLKLSLMSDWLAGRRLICLTRDQFHKQFWDRLNYYFLAWPTAHDSIS